MSFTDSEIVPATLDLQGIWLHDPMDPEGSVFHLPYGGPPGSMTTDVAQESAHYAGREFPVVDFGEHQAISVPVAVHVPLGPDWLAQITRLRELPERRRIMVYRDGRARNITGMITGMVERDERWGSLASFTVSRMDAA